MERATPNGLGARERRETDRDPDRSGDRRGRRNRGSAGGPAPSGFSLLPWLLLGMGAFSHLLQGEAASPWLAGLGLLAFNSLYIYVVFRSFVEEKRTAASTRTALALMVLVTGALALGYGGSWLNFFPLLGLAVGACLRGRWLGPAGVGLAVAAGVAAGLREGWTDGLSIAYGTLLSVMVTAAILSLSQAVRELRAAREELARRAVAEERLRFSRDLHDLLGHTLSVIVVKSEAARRLAGRDPEAAVAQITDIETVGRQALTEIREAVTGYRAGGLTAELDSARSALTAAGVEPVLHRSGPPLAPRTDTLLGWVLREAVTNVIRHSGATRCAITVERTPEEARLTVTDDGTPTTADGTAKSTGPGPGTGTGTGTGLTGLRERLTAAGGSLTAGPLPHGHGFRVTARLPAGPHDPAADSTPAAGAADSGAITNPADAARTPVPSPPAGPTLGP
ncbi:MULTISPECIES: sensor histidine kinase [unclassified Streptomyces]|uniref:sensor histidine kinase n=1 Tax=unclassified Streptomyces TaxID=2593676 RepID=UPI00380D2F70